MPPLPPGLFDDDDPPGRSEIDRAAEIVEACVIEALNAFGVEMTRHGKRTLAAYAGRLFAGEITPIIVLGLAAWQQIERQQRETGDQN